MLNSTTFLKIIRDIITIITISLFNLFCTLVICVTLGRSLHLSGPHFPQILNEEAINEQSQTEGLQL